MPTGEILRPSGPQDQEKLGQILCTNGDIIPFFNTKNLQKGEPVIFDIIRTNIQIKMEIDGVKYNYRGKIPVGILPLDFEIDDANPEKKWPAHLQKRWKTEWAEFRNDQAVWKKFKKKQGRSIFNHPHCDL